MSAISEQQTMEAATAEPTHSTEQPSSSSTDDSAAHKQQQQQQQQSGNGRDAIVASPSFAAAVAAATPSSSSSSISPPIRASHALHLHRSRPGSPAATSTAAFGFGVGARSSAGSFLAAGGTIGAARAQSPVSHAKLAHLKRRVEAQQAWGAASAGGAGSRSESPIQIPAPGRAIKSPPPSTASNGLNGATLASDPAAASREWASATPAARSSSSSNVASPSSSNQRLNLSLHELLTMEPGSPLGVAGPRTSGAGTAGRRAETPPTHQPHRQQPQRWTPQGLEPFDAAPASSPNGLSEQRFVPSRLQFEQSPPPRSSSSVAAAGLPAEASAYTHGAPYVPAAAAAASVAAAASYPAPPADQMIRPIYSPPRSLPDDRQLSQQDGPSLSAAMRSARPASLSLVARSSSAVRPLQSFDARGVPIAAAAAPSAPHPQAQLMRTPLSPSVTHLALHNALQSLKSPAPVPNAATASQSTDGAEHPSNASDPASSPVASASAGGAGAAALPLHRFETPIAKFVAPQVAEPIGLPIDGDAAAQSIGVRSLKQAHATRLGIGQAAPGSSPVAQPLMADARHIAAPLLDLGFDDDSGVDTDPARPSLPASLRSRNQAVMLRAEAFVSPLPPPSRRPSASSAATPTADRSGYASVLHSTFSPTPVRSKPSSSPIEQALQQRLQAHEEQQAQQAMQLRRLQLQLQLQQAQIQSSATPVTPTVVPASASIRNHAGPLSSPAATGSFLSSFFPASPPLSSPNVLSSLRAQAPQSAPRASALLRDAEVPVSLAKRPANELGYDPVSTPAKPGAHPLPQRTSSSRENADAASSLTASAAESTASSAAASPKPVASALKSTPPFFLDLKRLLSPDPVPHSPESKPSTAAASAAASAAAALSAYDDDEPQSHRSDHVGDVSSSSVEDHPAAPFPEASSDIAWTGPLPFLQQLEPLIKAAAANSTQDTSLPEHYAAVHRDALHLRETVAALRRFGASSAGARLLRTSESTTLLKKVHEAITSSANALLQLLCSPSAGSADSKTIGPVSSRDRAIAAVRALCAALSPHASGSSTSTGTSVGTRIALLSIEAASGEECFVALEAALAVLSRPLEVAPLRITTKASSEQPASPVVSPINTPRDDPEPLEPVADAAASAEGVAGASPDELEAVASHNFVGSAVGQLSFMKSGEVLSVRSKAVMGWVAVQNAAGVRGHVPESYLTMRRKPTEQEREAARAKEEAATSAAASTMNGASSSSSLPRIQALYPYTATAVGQLSFTKGEILLLLSSDMAGWLFAQKMPAAASAAAVAGAKGHVPENYFKKLPIDAPAPATKATAGAATTTGAAAAAPSASATTAAGTVAADAAATVTPAAATIAPSSDAKASDQAATAASSKAEDEQPSSVKASLNSPAAKVAPTDSSATTTNAAAPASASAATETAAAATVATVTPSASAAAATPAATSAASSAATSVPTAVAAPAGAIVSVKALFAFTSTAAGQLSVRQHELLTVVAVSESERQAEWIMVRNANKAQGFVPRNYCSPPIIKVRAAQQEDAAAAAAQAEAAEKAKAEAASAAAAAAAAALLTPSDVTPVDPVDAEAEAWAQRLSALESETRAAHIKAVALRAAYTKKQGELMRKAPGTENAGSSIELFHAQEAEAAEERALQAYEAAFDAHEDWQDGRRAAEAEAEARREKELRENPEAATKATAATVAEAESWPAATPTLASASSSSASSSAAPVAAAAAAAAAPPAAALEAVGLYLFMAPQNGQLAFKVGELLDVLRAAPLKGWLVARNARGMEGHIPENYVRVQPKEGAATAAMPEEKSDATETDAASAAPAASTSSSSATASPFVPGCRVTVQFPLLPSLSGGHLAAQAGEVLEVVASPSAGGGTGMVRARNKLGAEGMVPIKYLQTANSRNDDTTEATAAASVAAHDESDVEARDRMQESKYDDPTSDDYLRTRARSSSFPHSPPSLSHASAAFYTPTAASDEMLEADLELLQQTDAAIHSWNQRVHPSHPQPLHPEDPQFDASNLSFAGLDLAPEEQTRLAQQLGLEIDLGAGTPAARSGSGGADHLELELNPSQFSSLRSVALSRAPKPYAPFVALPFLRSRYDLSRDLKEGMEGVQAYLDGAELSAQTLDGMHSLIEARGLSGVYDELADTLTSLTASFCKSQHLLFERAMVDELRLEHTHMASLAAGDPSDDVEHRLMDRIFDARAVVAETMQLREARERLAKREARMHELEQEHAIMDRVVELQQAASFDQSDRAERMRQQQAQWDADDSSGDDEPDASSRHPERLNSADASDSHDSHSHAHVHRRQRSREGMVDSMSLDASASAPSTSLDPTPVVAASSLDDGEFDPHANVAPPPPPSGSGSSSPVPLHSILQHSHTAPLSPLVISTNRSGLSPPPPLVRGSSEDEPEEVHSALTNAVSPGPRCKKLRDTRSIAAQRQAQARAYSDAHDSDPTPITPHDAASLASKSASSKCVRWAPDSRLVNDFVNPAVESAYARDPDAEAEEGAAVMEEKSMEEVARQIEEEQREEQQEAQGGHDSNTGGH